VRGEASAAGTQTAATTAVERDMESFCKEERL
jgi:hypothetical protein